MIGRVFLQLAETAFNEQNTKQIGDVGSNVYRDKKKQKWGLIRNKDTLSKFKRWFTKSKLCDPESNFLSWRHKLVSDNIVICGLTYNLDLTWLFFIVHIMHNLSSVLFYSWQKWASISSVGLESGSFFKAVGTMNIRYFRLEAEISRYLNDVYD